MMYVRVDNKMNVCSITKTTPGIKIPSPKQTQTSTHHNPLALHDIKYGEAFLWVGLEHSLDEVLGVLAHIGPLRVGEGVLASADPLLHPRRDGVSMVTIEWRETTQPGGRKVC